MIAESNWSLGLSVLVANSLRLSRQRRDTRKGAGLDCVVEQESNGEVCAF